MTSPATAPDDPDLARALADGLAIAEVAQRTGLSKATLRYYEKEHRSKPSTVPLAGSVAAPSPNLDSLAFLLRQGHLLALESKITHYQALLDQQPSPTGLTKGRRQDSGHAQG